MNLGKLRPVAAVAALLFVVALTAAGSGARGDTARWRVVDGDDDCPGHRGGQYCEAREITLSADRDLLAIGAVNGSIRVEGWDRDEIHVVARVSVRAKSEGDARDIMDAVRIDTDGRVQADGPKRKWFGGGRSWSVSYRVQLPRGMRLDARTVNGGVTARGVSSGVDLATTNGNVEVGGARDDVEARTTNGSIRVGLVGDRLDGRGLDLHTTNGSIVVEMPSEFSAVIDASTVNGSIKIDSPIRIESMGRRSLKGTVGDGGSPIRARTTNGSVKFRQQSGV